VTPARLARGLYKTLKWLFLATLILILIAAGALYYLLGSDSGYRQLPDLIARFTPYTLEYDTLDGHLLGDQRWQNLHLHGAGLDVRAAELRLNLRARDLLSGARGRVFFIHLLAQPDELQERMAHREGHFMPSSLLPSQFAALEPLSDDEDGVTVVSRATPEETFEAILAALEHASVDAG